MVFNSETHDKWSLRASATGELVFDDVKIPEIIYFLLKMG